MERRKGNFDGALETDSQATKQRVDRALDILRGVLVDHQSNLRTAVRKTYGSSDLQALLKAFVDRFPEMLLRVGREASRSRPRRRATRCALHGGDGPGRRAAPPRNVRRLVKDLGAEKALQNVDRLYNEHLDSRRLGGEPVGRDVSRRGGHPPSPPSSVGPQAPGLVEQYHQPRRWPAWLAAGCEPAMSGSLRRRCRSCATAVKSGTNPRATPPPSAPRRPGRVCEPALAHVNSDRFEAAYRRSDLFERRRVLIAAATEVLHSRRPSRMRRICL